jgi:hypothetical protein
VNIDQLIKRLQTVGLSLDAIELITVWLKYKSFYVNIDGENSNMYDLLLGMVQGLVLGSILFATLFDICDLTSFTDDIYIPKWNSSTRTQILDMA